MVNNRTDILNRFAEAVARGVNEVSLRRKVAEIMRMEDATHLPQYLTDENETVRDTAIGRLRLLSNKSKGVQQDESQENMATA